MTTIKPEEREEVAKIIYDAILVRQTGVPFSSDTKAGQDDCRSAFDAILSTLSRRSEVEGDGWKEAVEKRWPGVYAKWTKACQVADSERVRANLAEDRAEAAEASISRLTAELEEAHETLRLATEDSGRRPWLSIVAKASQRIDAITSERDEAVAHVQRLQGALENVRAVVADHDLDMVQGMDDIDGIAVSALSGEGGGGNGSSVADSPALESAHAQITSLTEGARHLEDLLHEAQAREKK